MASTAASAIFRPLSIDGRPNSAPSALRLPGEPLRTIGRQIRATYTKLQCANRQPNHRNDRTWSLTAH